MMTIRKGKKEDCKGLLDLIHELAAYEKASHEVSLTLEQLLKDGFGERPLYEFFVAEIKSNLVGIALYYPRYSTWKGETLYLEDLVVKEEYRGNKIGSALFKALINEAKIRKVKRLEWQILDWNEPALNFYNKFKATLDHEWINGKLTDEDIDKLVS